MQRIEYTIKDMASLGDIPVNMLMKRMNDFGCRVTVSKGGRQADARNIFALLCLGIKQGDTVILGISGSREDEAAAFLRDFIEEKL